MSTRNQRRLLRKVQMKTLGGTSVTSKDVFMHMIGRMAEGGPEILSGLQAAVGGTGAETSGHVVDGLMMAAQAMEIAAQQGEADMAVDCMVMVLFLARHLAIREGKITTAPVASA